MEGIDGIKFIGARETMGPSISRKPKTLVDEELLTGIRNITAIVKAPIFISFPHFYKANEIYKNSISGMQPDQEKHEFSLVLQKVKYFSFSFNLRIHHVFNFYSIYLRIRELF